MNCNFLRSDDPLSPSASWEWGNPEERWVTQQKDPRWLIHHHLQVLKPMTLQIFRTGCMIVFSAGAFIGERGALYTSYSQCSHPSYKTPASLPFSHTGSVWVIHPAVLLVKQFPDKLLRPGHAIFKPGIVYQWVCACVFLNLYNRKWWKNPIKRREEISAAVSGALFICHAFFPFLLKYFWLGITLFPAEHLIIMTWHAFFITRKLSHSYKICIWYLKLL